MQRCRNCGGVNGDDSRFCEECGHALSMATDVAVAAAQPVHGLVTPPRPVAMEAAAAQSVSAAPPPTYGGSAPAHLRPSIPTLPGTVIALSEGERLWRSYPLVHFRPFRRRAGGTLYVTDSRIILHSRAHKATGRTSLLEEVRIESVTGIGSHLDRGLGLLGTAVLVLWILFGLASLFRGSAGLGVVMLFVAALVILVTYFYGRLGLRIYTNNTSPGPVAFGNFGVSRIQGLLGPLAILGMVIGGVQASDVLYCFPEKNAEEIVGELGALVFDLNRQGTLSGTQWEGGRALDRDGHVSLGEAP